MKRVKLLLVCLLVMLPALACVLPTPTSTFTPMPTHTLPPTHTPTSTSIPTNTPTLTNTPMPSVIRVEMDGSGDYTTLEEAVESAPEGVPIALGAGTFYLEESLEIRRPITLVGLGMTETEIVSEAEDYVFRFRGDGPFVVEDVTFRHEGWEAADVVVVQGGEVAFTRCRFAGGVYLEDEIWGVGLSLEKEVTGVVQGCEAVENGVGILVASRAEPTLEENVITDNEGSGIYYMDNAGGTARGNECSWNQSGIGVGGRAKPTLEENTCTDNQYSGIWYYGYEGGTAYHNECSGNGLGGIVVAGLSRPTLEENVCSDNAEVGITYLEEGSGVARGNECYGNWIGIHVEEIANPELIDNDCHDNIEADILDERP